MYKRKTVDVYHIYGDYGFGWDLEYTTYSRLDARDRLKEYWDNGGGVYKLIKKREVLKNERL